MKNRVAFLLGIANSKISTKLFIAFYFGDMLGRIACLAMAVVFEALLQERWAERTAGHAVALSGEASFFLDFSLSFVSRQKGVASAAKSGEKILFKFN